MKEYMKSMEKLLTERRPLKSSGGNVEMKERCRTSLEL